MKLKPLNYVINMSKFLIQIKPTCKSLRLAHKLYAASRFGRRCVACDDTKRRLSDLLLAWSEESHLGEFEQRQNHLMMKSDELF